jgi:hypothetical protein
MTKLTEQHLVELGFQRVDISKEESGMEDDFYYYDFDLGQFALISCDSDSPDAWYVEFFDCEGFRMREYEILKEFIDVLNKVHEQSKN